MTPQISQSQKNKMFGEFVKFVRQNPHKYYSIEKKLDEMIKYNVEVNSKFYAGQTLLHLAVKLNDARLCKLFSENGVLINLAQDNGDSPLHKAVIEAKINVIKTLIQLGADIDLTSDLEQTPLHKAVLTGKLNVVKTLVELGSDIRLVDESNYLPIDYAIDEKDKKIIKYLLTKMEVDETRKKKIDLILKNSN